MTDYYFIIQNNQCLLGTWTSYTESFVLKKFECYISPSRKKKNSNLLSFPDLIMNDVATKNKSASLTIIPV